MKKIKELTISELEQSYESYMLKIGKEQYLEYYGSSFDDMYIIVQIEHDGVKDIALIDFLDDSVEMRIYDECKFIVVDHYRVSLETFDYFIDEQSKYFDRVINYIENGDVVAYVDEH